MGFLKESERAKENTQDGRSGFCWNFGDFDKFLSINFDRRNSLL